MKIIALEIENPQASSEDFEKHAINEAQQVWKLIQQEKIREIYFKKDQDSAVIILESQNEAEAQNILSTLPYVKNNLISFELIPLVPYPGFDRLFRANLPK